MSSTHDIDVVKNPLFNLVIIILSFSDFFTFVISLTICLEQLVIAVIVSEEKRELLKEEKEEEKEELFKKLKTVTYCVSVRQSYTF